MNDSWIRELMQDNLVQERELEEHARIVSDMQEEIDLLKQEVAELEKALEECQNAKQATI